VLSCDSQVIIYTDDSLYRLTRVAQWHMTSEVSKTAKVRGNKIVRRARPWAGFGGFHALVLVEVTPTDVALLDPALDDGPIRLSRDGFLIAWEESDCLAAVISR
jgi:hypothetical protein